jgi:hypothetical protein
MNSFFSIDVLPDWTLAQGVEVAQNLEASLQPDFHVALAGSVLTKGMSFKDLDIHVYPHNIKASSYGTAKEALLRVGLVPEILGPSLYNDKFVERWRLYGKRVDIFYPYPFTELS